MMKFTVTAFLMLICTAALLSTTEARRTHRPRLRCRCTGGLKIHNLNNIVSLKVIPKGPHCSHMQIIAKMKIGETCLDPNVNWDALIKEMNNRNGTDGNQRI